MRFTITTLLLAFIVLIITITNCQIATATVYNETVGNNTNWFVVIEEGLGMGSGDNPPPQQENNENGDYDEYTEEIEERIIIEAATPTKHYARDIVSGIGLTSGLNTSDTAEKPKIPINWTPIIIWSIVAIFLMLLVGGTWYIYQIYYA